MFLWLDHVRVMGMEEKISIQICRQQHQNGTDEILFLSFSSGDVISVVLEVISVEIVAIINEITMDIGMYGMK